MKNLGIKGIFALLLIGSFGCDQSQQTTERQQPDEQVQAESAAESGYGSDSIHTNEDSDTTATP